MLVLVAVTLVILIAAAAFSVDMAYMFLGREQLKVATDAAAKATAVAMTLGDSQQTATNTAISYAAANTVWGQPLTLASSNVTLGKVTYSASDLWTFSAGGTPLTAVQVTGTASTPLFFAPALGTKQFSTTSTSTAAFVRTKWCFVFDISGSMCFDMSGTDWSYPPPIGYLSNKYPPSPYYPNSSLSRLANLVSGANTFLSALTNSPGGTLENEVGMITFSDSASTACTFTSTYSSVSNKLSYYLTTNIYSDGIYNGGTNLSAGLQAAFNLFTSTADGTPWNKVIIVFSDGEWNEGVDPTTLISQATSAQITIHTIGLLSGGNNTTMQQLAAQTGGQFMNVTNTSAVQTAFKKLAESTPVILTQ
jgi:Mg-chelatase subunit ChlD